MSTDEQLRPDDKAERVKWLIAQIENHEATAAALEAETKALGLDAKRIKAIRAAQKTLEALIGSNLLPEGVSIQEQRV